MSVLPGTGGEWGLFQHDLQVCHANSGQEVGRLIGHWRGENRTIPFANVAQLE
jgi:hypothetical protein